MTWIAPVRARELEAAGAHEQLAVDATTLLREALPGMDVEIIWDGVWLRRIGADYFPDPALFSTETPPFERWAGQAAKFLRDADDYWFHVYHPKPGDVIVDIGAGRGEDVYAFSRAVGPAGHVWAIEPHPETFAILNAFCRRNKLGNVTTLRYACVDEPGELQIETLPVWESNFVRPGEATAASYPVTGVTFDSLRERYQIDRIDFLKMNIEGAERFALPGCREALQCIANVCISGHDFRANRGEGESFRTTAFVKEFLRDAGFTLTSRDDDPRYYVPHHVHGSRSARHQKKTAGSRSEDREPAVGEVLTFRSEAQAHGRLHDAGGAGCGGEQEACIHLLASRIELRRGVQ